MSGWMDGWFQPSANVVSVLPNNSCQSDSSFFQGEKSMNMFKVVITAPKTLSQIPIRLHQVNNIIADVFGTLPLNLFFFFNWKDSRWFKSFSGFSYSQGTSNLFTHNLTAYIPWSTLFLCLPDTATTHKEWTQSPGIWQCSFPQQYQELTSLSPSRMTTPIICKPVSLQIWGCSPERQTCLFDKWGSTDLT